MTVVRERWIISATTVVPRTITEASIERVIEVAEVEPAARSDEARVKERAEADDEGRLIAPASVLPERHRKVRWRIRQTAQIEGLFPVAIDKDVTVRRPNVVRGDPDAAFLERRPVTGPPDKAPVAVDPRARHVRRLIVRRRRLRTLVERGRGLRRVGNLRLVGIGPEALNPAPPVIGLLPVTRNVLAILRRHAKHAAHPNMIFAFRVPRPVARYPLRVFNIRPFCRRFFRQGWRRRLGHHRPRLGCDAKWLRECFVQGAARQNLDSFFFLFVRKWNWFNFLRFAPTGQSKDGQQAESSKENLG